MRSNITFNNKQIIDRLLSLGFVRMSMKDDPVLIYRKLLVVFKSKVKDVTCYQVVYNHKSKYIFTQKKLISYIESMVLKIQSIKYENIQKGGGNNQLRAQRSHKAGEVTPC